ETNPGVPGKRRSLRPSVYSGSVRSRRVEGQYMPRIAFHNGTIILPDRLLPNGTVVADGGGIASVGDGPAAGELVDLDGGYLAPGFVDLHVHGGDGADFMDGSADAFRTVCRAHARHGTTALLATSTAAPPAEIVRFLECCRDAKAAGTGGAR